MDAKKTGKWKKYTIIMIVANVVIMGLYDVLALTEGGVDATISRVLYHGASEYPIIAVAFGVLTGHLFWPQKPEKPEILKED